MAALSDAGDTSTATGRTRLMGEGLCSCRERGAVAFGNKSTFVKRIMKAPMGAQ